MTSSVSVGPTHEAWRHLYIDSLFGAGPTHEAWYHKLRLLQVDGKTDQYARGRPREGASPAPTASSWRSDTDVDVVKDRVKA